MLCNVPTLCSDTWGLLSLPPANGPETEQGVGRAWLPAPFGSGLHLMGPLGCAGPGHPGDTRAGRGCLPLSALVTLPALPALWFGSLALARPSWLCESACTGESCSLAMWQKGRLWPPLCQQGHALCSQVPGELRFLIGCCGRPEKRGALGGALGLLQSISGAQTGWRLE